MRALHDSAGLRFFEVYVGTPITVCAARDPKGLYKKAHAGQIDGFLGVCGTDGVYESPTKPDLVIGTRGESVEECVNAVLAMLQSHGILSPEPARRRFSPPNGSFVTSHTPKHNTQQPRSPSSSRASHASTHTRPPRPPRAHLDFKSTHEPQSGSVSDDISEGASTSTDGGS